MEKSPDQGRIVVALYRGWKVEFAKPDARAPRIERRREQRPVQRERRRSA